MKKLHLMAAAILLALAGCKHDNLESYEAEHAANTQRPFGLKMGMTPKEVMSQGTNLIRIATGTFQADSLPLNHDGFSKYVLLFSAKSGLCSINAFSEYVPTMSSGDDLKTKFKYYEDVLSEKYGKPMVKIDQVEESETWGAPLDWMPSLLVGKRTLKIQWSLDPAQFNHLKTLTMTAQAQDRNKGFVNIQYSFTNEKSCLEDIRSESNKAL